MPSSESHVVPDDVTGSVVLLQLQLLIHFGQCPVVKQLVVHLLRQGEIFYHILLLHANRVQ